MRLINHKCEELLLETFRTYWETEPTTRCLYLRMSLLEQSREEWLPYLKVLLQQELDDDIKEIYLCYDGDIFILSRSLTHRRVNKFLSHLIPSFSPAPPPGWRAFLNWEFTGVSYEHF